MISFLYLYSISLNSLFLSFSLFTIIPSLLRQLGPLHSPASPSRSNTLYYAPRTQSLPWPQEPDARQWLSRTEARSDMQQSMVFSFLMINLSRLKFPPFIPGAQRR